jgi:Flp pilus assembly protein TadG
MFNTVREIAAVASARMRTLTSGFLTNKRGNVAVITAIAAVPLVSVLGCAVDYTMATTIRTRLQAAADAATLAAISYNSPITTTAKSMTGNGVVTGSQTYIQNFFNSNLAGSPENSGYTGATSSGSATKTGTTVTATISFSAHVPTYFLGIMGYSYLPVTGSSSSSYTLPGYIDFYMMLDVSGSMGFPSTASEQARLQAVNPDNFNGSNGYPTGCTFACHFAAQGTCAQTNASNPYQGTYPKAGTTTNPGTGGYCQGFIITRLGTTPTSFAAGTYNPTNGKNGVNWTNPQVSSCPTAGTTSCIQLQLDAVGYSITTLLTLANQTETNTAIPNQFRVGLFPFIQNLCYSNVNSSSSCSVGLTTSLTGSTLNNFASQLANQLDNGQNTTLGSGGTHLENALNTMNATVIPNPAGTGTSSNPLPYLFIITDGSQDYQTQSGGNWSSQNWTANATVPYQNSATVIPPNTVTKTDYCTTLKNRGVTIAILYIPYQTIQNPNPNFASNEDGYANNNIQYIPSALQTCASPNFFFTASSPTQITTQLQTMFNQAVSTAHVSN